MLKLIAARGEKPGATSWTKLFVIARETPRYAELFPGTQNAANVKTTIHHPMFQVSLYEREWPGVPHGTKTALCWLLFNQPSLWQVWPAKTIWPARGQLPLRTYESSRSNGPCTLARSKSFMQKLLSPRPGWSIFWQPIKQWRIPDPTQHHLPTVCPNITELCTSQHSPTGYRWPGWPGGQIAWDWGQKCLAGFLIFIVQ